MESEWMKPEIILTIYAAVISTISLVWNIILAVLEKRSCLKVIVEFRDSSTVNAQEQLIVGPKVLYIRIINESKYTKYINGISIKLPYEINGQNIMTLFKKNVQFPIELPPEKEYIFKFPFRASNSEELMKYYQEGKCKIIVMDTVRKCYKSASFSSKKLRGVIEFNKKLSDEVLTLFNA